MTSTRIFTILSSVTILFCFCLTHGLGSLTIELDNNPCTTKSCIDIASHLLKYINESVDPCDNFYQFSCGKFLNSTNIPHDKDKINQFEILHDLALEQIQSLLNESIKPTDFDYVKKAKTYYQSCQKSGARYEGLVNIAKDLGGWPVLDGELWDEKQFDWKKVVQKFDQITPGHLLILQCEREKNSCPGVFKLSEPYYPHYGDPVDLSNKNSGNPYLDTMIEVAVALGAKKEEAEKELVKSLEFEFQLSDISSGPHQEEYTPMKLSTLMKNYSDIPWNNCTSGLYSEKMDDDATILTSPYIDRLKDIMDITPKRVQANYLIWRAINTLWRQIVGDTRRNDNPMLNAKKCTEETYSIFKIYLSKAYLEKYFPANMSHEANSFIENIKNQVSKTLQNVSESDVKFKECGPRRLAELSFIVFQPHSNIDDKKIEKYYKDLEMDENYVLNYFRTKKLRNRFRFQSFSAWNSFEFLRPAITKYDPNPNIQIPAAMFQQPIFDIDAPKYINYGGLGRLVDREIIRNILSTTPDSYYSWSTCSTVDEFQKISNCLTDQYNTCVTEENGVKTNKGMRRSHPITQYGEIKLAYLAYNDWLTKNGPEINLPNLAYTNRQLFWINAAHGYCSKTKSERLEYEKDTNIYQSAECQVNSQLSNAPEFAKDFYCPIGSKMNPEKKCSRLYEMVSPESKD